MTDEPMQGFILTDFICGDCAAGRHDTCAGATHCDCQHRPPREPEGNR